MATAGVTAVAAHPVPKLAAARAGAAPTRAHADSLVAVHGPRLRAFIQQKRTLSYPFSQVWPTAIRYLRIDRGYGIDERDQDAGFVLFSFPMDGDRKGHGSVEMLQTEDASGRPSVQIMVNTSAGPTHLPHTILDGISSKVRSERGQPAPPPPNGPSEPDGPEEQPPDDGSPPMMPPAENPG